MKTLKGGEAMKKEQVHQQALLGGETQQNQAVGGGAMRELQTKTKRLFDWFYHIVYDPDRYPERLYELPAPKLVKAEEFEDGRIIEVYQLSDGKGLIRDTRNNGNLAWCFIGVSSEWHDEYIFCLRVCDNDMFEFVDL
jgi:hypothetical protein